jgi:hypothetical protein
MNTLNPIDSLFSPNTFSPSVSPFVGATNFGSVFDQAMSQATTPAEKAKVTWLQAKFHTQNILYDMFSSDKSSTLGFGMSDLFGVDGPFGLPSWVFDAQRLLGDAETQKLISISQQTSELLQRRMNHGFNSLI